MKTSDTETEGFTAERAGLHRRIAELEARNRELAEQLVRSRQSHQLGVLQATSDRLRVEELTRTRLRLYEFAATHTLHELLVETLDEAERLSSSLIGFYHFVSPDQETLSLQAWSTRTARDFCRAAAAGSHYSISVAGVWVDSVRDRRPVIHNDYAALPHRRGMPPGHATVVREVVVPILRDGVVVAILGVGNKATDYDDEDVAVLTDLANAAWEIAERKRAEEALRRSDAKLRAVVEHSSEGIVFCDPAANIHYRSPSYIRINGFADEDRLGHSGFETVHPDDVAHVAALWRRVIDTPGGLETGVYRIRHRDGHWLWVESTAQNLLDHPDVGEVVVTTRDITGRKRAEEEQERLRSQLFQAQKMEAIGRLAGGVAHDFNNLLTIIQGNAEQGLEELGPAHPTHGLLAEVSAAAQRSAALTRQLLAFARRQVITPRVLDLNDTVEGMLKMLRRLLGENLTLAWYPGTPLWPVRMDPSQLDQILANLCVNARDAIADVGRVVIETANVTVSEEGQPAGEFVRIRVQDDGCGMDAETAAHIFEPFFTTKGEGKGTGLGLATVYGIVRQNRGFISVDSAPGRGATFSIHVPRHVGAADPQPVAPSGRGPGGHETVLLVEDEPGILQLVTRQLGARGFTVLAARRPSEALRLAEQHAGPIHLLLTDVVMPERNGNDLARELLRLHPRMRCLFMSGYTADIVAHHGVIEADAAFIQKPFSTRDLVARLRALMDESAGG